MDETEKEKTLEQVASLMKQLLPLVKLVASEEFSEAERSRLNETTGHLPLHLGNALIPLCGKDPREEMARQREFLEKFGSSIKNMLADLPVGRWKRASNRK